MKPLSKVIIPLLSLPLLASCTLSGVYVISDKTSSIASISNIKTTEIYFKCQKCEGDIIYGLTIKDNQSTTMKTNIIVEEGTLSFKILNNDKTEIYAAELTNPLEYEIPLEKTGKYRLEISHHSYRGSYKFNWAK